MWFAGSDWADKHHDVVVLDAQGQRLSTRRYPHSAEGLGSLRGDRRTLGASAEEVVGVVEMRGGDAWWRCVVEMRGGDAWWRCGKGCSLRRSWRQSMIAAPTPPHGRSRRLQTHWRAPP
jgi:hypothetical protein